MRLNFALEDVEHLAPTMWLGQKSCVSLLISSSFTRYGWESGTRPSIRFFAERVAETEITFLLLKRNANKQEPDNWRLFS